MVSIFAEPFWNVLFNQVNIDFEENEIQCLLDRWYAKTYQEEQPIVFRVIKVEAVENAFFGCKPGTTPHSIDFSKNSLRVGMKADKSNPVDSPVNIRKMVPNLPQQPNEDCQLPVTVTGRRGTGSGWGGEWFGFTTLVPKIQGEVKLVTKDEWD